MCTYAMWYHSKVHAWRSWPIHVHKNADWIVYLLQGLDIGPDSLKAFQSALADAKTIIWNGPMGVFEFEKFAKGTFGVADTLAELSAKVSCLPCPHLECKLECFCRRCHSSQLLCIVVC